MHNVTSSLDPNQDEIQQEYVDNHGTDVEVEDPDAESAHDPWDPELIRIHTRTYSLRQIVDMIDEEDIDLAPDFQRQYVWGATQRWNLIESLLLGIPLPSFYFNEDTEGRLQVVDGVQRLTTIHGFYKNKFGLGTLTYLNDLEGQRFSDLAGLFRRRLQNTQFIAHVIDPQTPYRVKFDVFKRINTGGTPLSAQEIRHCMSLNRSRQFLQKLVSMEEFAAVMGRTVLNHPRMADREIALRLVAFHVVDVSDYPEWKSLDAFLGEVTNRIDRYLSVDELNSLEERAAIALINAKAVFGSHAFRKWPFTTERRNPVSRTLVESWGYHLSTVSPNVVAANAEALCFRARTMMTTDTEFINSTSGGTGDPRKVAKRLELVGAAVAEVLG